MADTFSAVNPQNKLSQMAGMGINQQTGMPYDYQSSVQGSINQPQYGMTQQIPMQGIPQQGMQPMQFQQQGMMQSGYQQPPIDPNMRINQLTRYGMGGI